MWHSLTCHAILLVILGNSTATTPGDPMQFLYSLSPATWLKIAIGSLLLALACLAVLMGYRINISLVAPPAKPSAPGKPQLAANLPSAPLIAPPSEGQTQALAPEGILDPLTEFKPVTTFEDSVIKPNYVLPPALAPLGLLDPDWTGAAP
jgi:hypothetical protein